MKRLLVAAAACVAALAPLSAGAVTSQMAPLKVVSCVVGYLNSGTTSGFMSLVSKKVPSLVPFACTIDPTTSVTNQ